MTVSAGDSRQSYPSYLQAQAKGGDIELTASERAVLGSAGAIAALISDGENMGGLLQRQTVTTADIQPRFHWGRSEDLLGVGAFAASLKELKDRARSSAEMWAFEQYATACDAFRRGLHQEALEYLRRAIEGDEGHEGYDLDFRIHFLAGLIRLGSCAHHDGAVLDTAEAEQAFRRAARCARCDYPVEAGWCLLGAGWACYWRGDLEDAATLTDQAVVLLPKPGAAHFQAAKIRYRLRHAARAEASLLGALDVEPIYALWAARDGDCVLDKEALMETVRAARDRRVRGISHVLSELNDKAVTSGVVAGPDAPPRGDNNPLGELEQRALELLDATHAAAGERTFFGYAAAEVLARRAMTGFDTILTRREQAGRLADDAIHAAQEALGQFGAMETAGYAFAKVVPGGLQKARALVTTAEAARRDGSQSKCAEAERLATEALTALGDALEAYRSTVLREVAAERNALAKKLEEARARHGSHGNFALIGAAIGGSIAIIPGGYASLFAGGGPRTGDWPAALMGLGIVIAISSAIGAVLGAMFVPADSESAARHPPLENRIAALDGIIAQLRALSLAKSASRPPQPRASEVADKSAAR